MKRDLPFCQVPDTFYALTADARVLGCGSDREKTCEKPGTMSRFFPGSRGSLSLPSTPQLMGKASSSTAVEDIELDSRSTTPPKFANRQSPTGSPVGKSPSSSPKSIASPLKGPEDVLDEPLGSEENSAKPGSEPGSFKKPRRHSIGSLSPFRAGTALNDLRDSSNSERHRRNSIGTSTVQRSDLRDSNSERPAGASRGPMGHAARWTKSAAQSVRGGTPGFFTPGAPPSPGMSPKAPPTGHFFVPGANTPTDRTTLRRSSVFRAKEVIRTQDDRTGQLRLLRRDAPFHQSNGHIYMHRKGASTRLALNDAFHVMLAMPWLLLTLLCVSMYTGLMVTFALFYMALDHPGLNCGIGLAYEYPSFYHAFAFSMETMTTIGYGIPHSDSDFFEPVCTPILVAVYFEAMIFILLNASIVGVLFARVAAANRRASQIILSNKAVIRCVRSRFYFMFQVAEASFFTYHPVVEAHVRVYAVLHEEITRLREDEGGSSSKASSSSEAAGGAAKGKALKDAAGSSSGGGEGGGEKGSRHIYERAYFQTRVMRLTNPNDELGGMIFLATPQVVSHRIDRWSPLFPPAARLQDNDNDHDGKAYHFPGLVFREADREVAIADESHDTRGRRSHPQSSFSGTVQASPAQIRRSSTRGMDSNLSSSMGLVEASKRNAPADAPPAGAGLGVRIGGCSSMDSLPSRPAPMCRGSTDSNIELSSMPPSPPASPPEKATRPPLGSDASQWQRAAGASLPQRAAAERARPEGLPAGAILLSEYDASLTAGGDITPHARAGPRHSMEVDGGDADGDHGDGEDEDECEDDWLDSFDGGGALSSFDEEMDRMAELRMLGAADQRGRTHELLHAIGEDDPCLFDDSLSSSSSEEGDDENDEDAWNRGRERRDGIKRSRRQPPADHCTPGVTAGARLPASMGGALTRDVVLNMIKNDPSLLADAVMQLQERSSKPEAQAQPAQASSRRQPQPPPSPTPSPPEAYPSVEAPASAPLNPAPAAAAASTSEPLPPSFLEVAANPPAAAPSGRGKRPSPSGHRKSSLRSETQVEFAATGSNATMGQLRRMQELIRQHLQRSKLEVIIVVEAIDPHSSNTFQARHSYTSDDIEFDKSFQSCMRVDPADGMARLDWSSFHQVYKVPFNATQIIGGSHS